MRPAALCPFRATPPQKWHRAKTYKVYSDEAEESRKRRRAEAMEREKQRLHAKKVALAAKQASGEEFEIRTMTFRSPH